MSQRRIPLLRIVFPSFLREATGFFAIPRWFLFLALVFCFVLLHLGTTQCHYVSNRLSFAVLCILILLTIKAHEPTHIRVKTQEQSPGACSYDLFLLLSFFQPTLAIHLAICFSDRTPTVSERKHLGRSRSV